MRGGQEHKTTINTPYNPGESGGLGNERAMHSATKDGGGKIARRALLKPCGSHRNRQKIVISEELIYTTQSGFIKEYTPNEH